MTLMKWNNACMDKILGDFKTNPLGYSIHPANWQEAQEELKMYSVEVLSYLLNHFAEVEWMYYSKRHRRMETPQAACAQQVCSRTSCG